MSKNIKNETFKYSMTSGLLYRNSIKSKIQTYCFHKDIKFNLIENKGFLESTLLYAFNASETTISELKLFLEGLINPYKTRFEQSKADWIIKKYGETLSSPLKDITPFSVLGLRSENELNNSFNDIADAIKQTLLISKENEHRQALIDSYVTLGVFLDVKNYDKLLDLCSKYQNLSKEEKEDCDYLIQKVSEEMRTAQEQLEKDIYEFQITNGFI